MTENSTNHCLNLGEDYNNAWKAQPKSARAQDDERVLGLVKQSWLESGLPESDA
jgi:hypothetical protein